MRSGNMRIKRSLFITMASAFALAIACMLMLAGCAGTATGPSTKLADNLAAVEAGDSDYYMFTDSAGREVPLPRNIETVSPSGAYAKIYLSSLGADKLISLPSNYSDKQQKYIGERISTLPTTGSFYGKNTDMNYEEIIKMSPDVIIDVGEKKDDIAADLDKLQEQTGLPVIFVEATLENAATAVRTLGDVLGSQEKAEPLAAYIDETFEFAAAHRDEIAAMEYPKVLYTAGPYGYEVKGSDKIHGAVLKMVGANNVADLSGMNSNNVSPEQVMVWAPDVVLLSASSAFYDGIMKDPTWASIPAIVNGRVYEVPDDPYEWMDKPPSVQTVLGVKWLGNLLYPEIYDFDMVAETQEFYKLLWDYDMPDEEARELLSHSTFRE